MGERPASVTLSPRIKDLSYLIAPWSREYRYNAKPEPRSGLHISTGEVETPPIRGRRFNGNNVKFCDSRLKPLFASIRMKVKERLREVYQTFKESRS
jgi:hypothetical protein